MAILGFLQREPWSNKEFKHIVEKMITAEKKTRERFLDQNNRDNPDGQNHQNNGHQDRKWGPDNVVAVADKAKNMAEPPKSYDPHVTIIIL
jgi:hypothetical protein